MDRRAVSEAIENAKEAIFIADWWLVSYKNKDIHMLTIFYFL